MVLAHMGKDLIYEGICALFFMVHPHMAFLRHLIAWTEAWTVLRGHGRNAVNRYSINELGDLPLATWLADLV